MTEWCRMQSVTGIQVGILLSVIVDNNTCGSYIRQLQNDDHKTEWQNEYTDIYTSPNIRQAYYTFYSVNIAGIVSSQFTIHRRYTCTSCPQKVDYPE